MRVSSRSALLATVAVIASLTALPASAATTGSIFGHGTAGFTISSPPADLYSGPDVPIFGKPFGFADVAGEPSIGANWNTGAALFMAGSAVYKVTRDASTGAIAWSDTTPLASVANLDPILVTEPRTGLTVAGGDNGPCGGMSVSSDDGASWLPTAPCTGTTDHPGIGWSPSATTPGANVLYYCQQEIFESCTTSIDGGLTWIPGVPNTNLDCMSLAGHPKGSNDGTAYLPDVSCFDANSNTLVGGLKTTDDGLTWTGYTIPGAPTPADGFDPAVVTTPDNTLYEAWDNAGNYHPVIAKSTTHGDTWGPTIDLANTVTPPIIASTFPTLVAGDNGRVAYSFLGTQTGDPNVDPFQTGFHGKWYLFTSYTYDGGATWTTVQDTPTPVQYGEIDAGGTTTTGQRNLLDFIDSTVTKDGRVVVAFADGCLADCEAATSQAAAENLSTHSFATVAYQNVGRGLFSAYDVAVAPSAPVLTTSAGAGSVALSWNPPLDDGGAAITGYQVTRSAGADPATALTTVTATSFTDTAVTAGSTYSYTVTAVNSAGVGDPSNSAAATPYAVPAAPILTGAGSGGTISLSWSAPAANGAPITGYQIRRGTSAGQETALADSTGTSFTDTGLAAGPTYYYTVTALNAAGPGAASNEVSVKTASVPGSPVLTATAGRGQVSLSWTAPASDLPISQYQIYRGSVSGGETLTQTISTGTTYIDGSVTGGLRYFYRVVAVSAAGAGSASNEASATPKPSGKH